MIKLSKRLETISSLVPKNSNIVDIGCDHGLLDIYLHEKKISNKIIASDINEFALNSAINNIKKYNLDKYIETRLGSGLDTITDKDNIDTVVISGMGAHTIIGILLNNKQKLKNINTLIIQSNTKMYLLRKEITKLDYYIEDEVIVIDNKKTYIIIKFQKGKKKYTKKELYFGPVLIKNNSKLFKEYKEKELKKLIVLYELIPKNRIISRHKIKKEINLYK